MSDLFLFSRWGKKIYIVSAYTGSLSFVSVLHEAEQAGVRAGLTGAEAGPGGWGATYPGVGRGGCHKGLLRASGRGAELLPPAASPRTCGRATKPVRS